MDLAGRWLLRGWLRQGYAWWITSTPPQQRGVVVLAVRLAQPRYWIQGAKSRSDGHGNWCEAPDKSPVQFLAIYDDGSGNYFLHMGALPRTPTSPSPSGPCIWCEKMMSSLLDHDSVIVDAASSLKTSLQRHDLVGILLSMVCHFGVFRCTKLNFIGHNAYHHWCFQDGGFDKTNKVLPFIYQLFFFFF
jgi:hypothetical protein